MIITNNESNLDLDVLDTYEYLKEKLNERTIEKENLKKKNDKLIEQIEELLSKQKEIEKHMDRAKKDSTVTDIKIEPTMYLKGMFDSFDKKDSSLKILIEGNEYYYSLENYQCKYLPISGARVLIFRSYDHKILIYGFDMSKIIDPPTRIKVDVKAINQSLEQLKLYCNEYGYINVHVSKLFFANNNLKLGQHLILNQIYIEGNYYFYIADNIEIAYDRNEILKQIRKG